MSKDFLQSWIHSLEEGKGAVLLRTIAIVVFAITALVILVFDPFQWRLFKGLSNPYGMEQAIVAREITRGNGYSTQIIRPLMVAQLDEKKEGIPAEGPLPETMHGPVWPTMMAGALIASRADLAPIRFDAKQGMQAEHFVYRGDRIIAVLSILLFYAALWLNFRTVRQLFDTKVAWLTLVSIVLCFSYWQYAMSGLPQMAMYLIVSLILHLSIPLLGEAKPPSVIRLAVIGALFGVLALTHALTIWLFLGYLVYCGVALPARGTVLSVLMGVFLIVLTPWLIRNHQVSGYPLGLGWYTSLTGIAGSENIVMRSETVPDAVLPIHQFRRKIQSGIAAQLGDYSKQFGSILLAPLFFLALLHPFKRVELQRLRWVLLLMWIGALVGMTLWSSSDGVSPVKADNLFLLLIPFFVAYGLAFLFILLGRMELRTRWVKHSVVGVFIALSFIPLFNQLTFVNRFPFHWPPYVPPYIAILSQWSTPQEVIATDNPPGVSWYADRTSFFLPMDLKQFIQISDERRLKRSIAGIYLSPITTHRGLRNEIWKGDFRAWAPLVMLPPGQKLNGFPFSSSTELPIGAESVFFSDWARWDPEETRKLNEATLEDPGATRPKNNEADEE